METYFGLGINTETKDIKIMSIHPLKEVCDKNTKERLEEANCSDYKIFCLNDNNTGKTREDLLWWFSEYGITRLEGFQLIERLCDLVLSGKNK